jgi:hypothetical protein
MNRTHFIYSAQFAFVAATLIATLVLGSFIVFEPTLSRSANPHDFVVSQQITNEVSFLLEAADVSMVGSIAGITGGYATGTTRVVVNTNNPTGYSMTLLFADLGSTNNAMQASSTAYINNYSPATPGTPDFTWVDNGAGGAAEFGYTVRASTTSEVAAIFRNNGSACNAGSNETDDRCWMSPSTTAARTIINSTAPNANSTSTIKFRVAVPSNPSPALPAGFYYATGTLTATTN